MTELKHISDPEPGTDSVLLKVIKEAKKKAPKEPKEVKEKKAPFEVLEDTKDIFKSRIQINSNDIKHIMVMTVENDSLGRNNARKERTL